METNVLVIHLTVSVPWDCPQPAKPSASTQTAATLAAAALVINLVSIHNNAKVRNCYLVGQLCIFSTSIMFSMTSTVDVDFQMWTSAQQAPIPALVTGRLDARYRVQTMTAPTTVAVAMVSLWTQMASHALVQIMILFLLISHSDSLCYQYPIQLLTRCNTTLQIPTSAPLVLPPAHV